MDMHGHFEKHPVEKKLKGEEERGKTLKQQLSWIISCHFILLFSWVLFVAVLRVPDITSLVSLHKDVWKTNYGPVSPPLNSLNQ